MRIFLACLLLIGCGKITLPEIPTGSDSTDTREAQATPTPDPSPTPSPTPEPVTVLTELHCFANGIAGGGTWEFTYDQIRYSDGTALISGSLFIPDNSALAYGIRSGTYTHSATVDINHINPVPVWHVTIDSDTDYDLVMWYNPAHSGILTTRSIPFATDFADACTGQAL